MRVCLKKLQATIYSVTLSQQLVKKIARNRQGSITKINMKHNSTKCIKEGQTAKIRKRYNQVPHLTQDTTRESNKKYNKHHKQEVSPFPAGDHKAAMNRRERMRIAIHKNTNDPQKKYRLGTVSKSILLEGLNRFHGADLTFSSDMDQDT